MNTNNSQASDFSGLGIAPVFMETLTKLKYEHPTPIQQQAIPVAIEGKDVMGIAQTGTGKTVAFGIPMIQRLHQIKGRGLVILPTRELAVQVEESLRRLGAGVGLRTVVLIGGAPMRPQVQAIQRDPHIIIATPGRLLDHIDQRILKLDNIKVVVLDEADRMLDMGFAPQIKKVLALLSTDRQTMLFSATMPPTIMKMATSYMKLPLRIEVTSPGTTADKVSQEIFVLPKDAKVRLVEKLLQQYLGTTLIFTKTKHGAKKLALMIREMGHTSVELHSNRSLAQRQDALAGFKSGRYRVLIATDIASRGIDVTGIELVINFDLPADSEDYVHRIGRTARAGASGHAISLVTPDQRGALRNIERLVKKSLPISKLPELPPARILKGLPQEEPMNHHGHRPMRQGGRPQAPHGRRPIGRSQRGPNDRSQGRFKRG